MSAVCGREYHDDTGDVLGARIEATKTGIAAAPLMFVTQPYTTLEYANQEEALTSTYSAYKRGGLAQRGPYDTQWAAAILMMDNTADYVNGIAKGSVTVIVQAAFKPVNDGRVAAVKPTQARLVNWWLVFTPNFVVTKTKGDEKKQGSHLCTGKYS